MTVGNPALRDDVQQILDGFERLAAERPELRPAAVAIAIVLNDADEACFVLTRRAAKLRAHAGQWALPGGSLEVSEVPADAARREMHEEVALDLPPEAVLGMLDDYPTRSGFVITPVVLWAGRLTEPLRPAASEVAEVYVVPLKDLDVEPQFVRIPESDAPVIKVPLLDHLIHAPTAAVLYQFREAILHRRSTRVAHFEQPVFAWR